MIEIKTQRLASGRRARFGPLAGNVTPDSCAELNVLLCERYSHVSVPAGMVGLWCPLKNGIWVDAVGARFFVKRGEIFASDAEYPHEINTPMLGACVAVIAEHAVWAKLMSLHGESDNRLPVAFPARHSASASLRRLLLRLARAALQGSDTSEKPVADHFGQLLVHLQHPFAAMLERCPGPSVARKRQVFLRLQRARHLIQTSSSRDIDIATLAALTSYSPNQLIKLFQKIFGETPYASLLRTRVEFARQLITQSSMGIREVSRLSGFENRTTFARAFKVHFGSTASSYRSISRRAG